MTCFYMFETSKNDVSLAMFLQAKSCVTSILLLICMAYSGAYL